MADTETTTKTCSRCKMEKPTSAFCRNKSRKDGLQHRCKDCSAGNGPPIGQEDHPRCKAPEGTKWCRRCNHTKARIEFASEPKHRDGLVSFCRECNRKISQEWKERNREHTREYSRAYSKARPEQARARDRLRAVRYPGRTSAQSRQWRIANRIRYRELKAAWKKANPDKVNAGERRRYAADPQRFINKVHMRRMKLQEGPGVTMQDIARIRLAQRDRCALCRKPLRGKGQQDHIISLKCGGVHEPKNIQLTHAICNKQKSAKDPIAFMRQRGFLL